jgi:rhodanese-related sulfurtransferase
MTSTKITMGYKALLDDAEKRIQSVTPQQAMAEANDPAVLIVDLRDIREIEREGRIPGSFHAPRGMLEFWVDPESPYHKPALFSADTHYVLFCGGGWRSALAAHARPPGRAGAAANLRRRRRGARAPPRH